MRSPFPLRQQRTQEDVLSCLLSTKWNVMIFKFVGGDGGGEIFLVVVIRCFLWFCCVYSADEERNEQWFKCSYVMVGSFGKM